MEEFTGRTNTAIHTYTSFFGSYKFPVKDNTPMTITGIQQKKSVRIMNIIFAAIAVSRLTLVDLTAPPTRFAVTNIAIYATSIKIKAMKLKAMKNETEYSHPAGLSDDNCRGRHTPERP